LSDEIHIIVNLKLLKERVSEVEQHSSWNDTQDLLVVGTHSLYSLYEQWIILVHNERKLDFNQICLWTTRTHCIQATTFNLIFASIHWVHSFQNDIVRNVLHLKLIANSILVYYFISVCYVDFLHFANKIHYISIAVLQAWWRMQK